MHQLRTGTKTIFKAQGDVCTLPGTQSAFVCPRMKGTVEVLETFETESGPWEGFGYLPYWWKSGLNFLDRPFAVGTYKMPVV